MPVPQSLAESFAALGFVPESTGDNCTAYVRRYEDGTAHHVTLQSDPLIPEHPEDLCGVALLDADGQPIADEVEGITAEDVILLFLNHGAA